MLLDPKKKFASVIVDRLKSESPIGPEPQEDASAGKEAAMEKFMSCMSSKDAKGMAAALTDFIDMHETAPHEEYEEPEMGSME